jgi:hypothetical protein
VLISAHQSSGLIRIPQLHYSRTCSAVRLDLELLLHQLLLLLLLCRPLHALELQLTNLELRLGTASERAHCWESSN